MHGIVSYTLGGGIDRPLAIHKEGSPSIVTHQAWRGQFATTGCTKILWPGGRTTAWHHDQKDPDIRNRGVGAGPA